MASACRGRVRGVSGAWLRARQVHGQGQGLLWALPKVDSFWLPPSPLPSPRGEEPGLGSGKPGREGAPQSSSSSSSSSVSLLGAHLWKHCTTVAKKKLEMMAAMDTATPEKMMMNRSVSDRLNLHSLKLASDSSCRNILLFPRGREHWISSRPVEKAGGVRETSAGQPKSWRGEGLPSAEWECPPPHPKSKRGGGS